jgi:hypothetical protein
MRRLWVNAKTHQTHQNTPKTPRPSEIGRGTGCQCRFGCFGCALSIEGLLMAARSEDGGPGEISEYVPLALSRLARFANFTLSLACTL